MTADDVLTRLLDDGHIVETAEKYSEPGYDDPPAGRLILFSDWSGVSEHDMAVLENAGHEMEWSDEWDKCDECSGAVRTSANCYLWKPAYYRNKDDIVCERCVLANDGETRRYIDWCNGDFTRAITIDGIDLEKFGYKKLNDHSLQTGFHGGMNDDPETLGRNLQKVGVTEFVFVIDENSQFYTNWSVWIKTDIDVEMPNSKLPYDMATEMGKALRGEPTKHVDVVERTITPEEFIKGVKIKTHDKPTVTITRIRGKE
ncbi:MAG: hypothetical protein AMS21_00660 [Gemmatimonas sp. SG8_38_2]|nr:MAG: hypothetical protein AMS21_00660 [Gemmatimonas sp. SG8_38_2]